MNAFDIHNNVPGTGPHITKRLPSKRLKGRWAKDQRGMSLKAWCKEYSTTSGDSAQTVAAWRENKRTAS